MKNSSRVNDAFCSNDLEYGDTDSVYVENKHWDNLGKTGLLGKDLPQDKKDYRDGGLVHGLFLTPKIKFC